MNVIPQLGSLVLAVVVAAGATVAVCLGKIDAPTYIAVVGTFGGAGLGAGIHAQGVTSATGVTTSGGTVAGQ